MTSRATRLTIRSSRPHVVAAAACFALRLHASAAPPRVGLTQALSTYGHPLVVSHSSGNSSTPRGRALSSMAFGTSRGASPLAALGCVHSCCIACSASVDLLRFCSCPAFLAFHAHHAHLVDCRWRSVRSRLHACCTQAIASQCLTS